MTTSYRSLRPHVATFIEQAASSMRGGDVPGAWLALERAHIVSQPSVRLHVRVHWLMLLQAFRTWDLREVFGQLVRIAVAGPGSAAGRYPVGNTGRARVPMFQPMPIPPGLAALLEGEKPGTPGAGVAASARSAQD